MDSRKLSAIPEQHDMSNENQNERVKRWLSEVEHDSTIHRKSKQRDPQGVRTVSVRSSVALSEELDFKTAYVRQAAATKDQTVEEEWKTNSHKKSKEYQTPEIVFDSASKNSQYISTSIYTQASALSSVRLQRNKTLSKLTGTSASSLSRSKSTDSTRQLSSSRTTLDSGPSTQSSKHITNHIVHIHLANRQLGRTGTELVTTRETKAIGNNNALGRQSVDEIDVPLAYREKPLEAASLLEDKHQNGRRVDRLPSAQSKKTRKSGPVKVTRDSTGNLQFERCKHGIDHTMTEYKSHRRRLAEYIAGNYH